jgi:hypothetical protein
LVNFKLIKKTGIKHKKVFWYFKERIIMNKKLLLIAGVAAASAGIYSSTFAATVTGSASANVLTPISIAAGTNAMNFGDVAGDATNATTVVLTTGGATSSPDGASTAGTPTAGDFTVTGSGTLSYNITLPTSTVLSSAGNPDMTVDTFTDSLGGSGTLASGTQDFTVGATLTINANQPAATYNGTYDITVEYQ